MSFFRSIESLESRTLLSAGQVDASSRPLDFVQLGGTTYFIANDGIHGNELMRVNASDNGATLVKDVKSGSTGGAYRLWTFKNSLYFSGPNGLWKTDGTSAGTVNISSVIPFGNSQFAVGDTLYFFSTSDTRGLYKTNGSTGGTSLVKSFYDVSILGSANGSVIYMASDSSSDPYHLWASGGSAGTATQLRPEALDSFPYEINAVSFDGDLYFFDTSPTTGVTDWLGDGYGLWKTDGTPGGTTRISSEKPSAAAVVADGVLFTVVDQFGSPPSHTLWKSNGTSADTAPLTDVPDAPRNLIGSGNRAYFTVGSQLWTSDGTANGTHLAKDIGFGEDHLFTGSNGTIFSFGNSDIWRSDGTAGGTTKLADIPSDVSVGLLSAEPSGNKLYFNARATHGWEPWIANSSGIDEVANVNTQPPAAPTHLELATSNENGESPTNKPSFYVRTDEDPTQVALYVDGKEVVRKDGSQYVQVTVPTAISNGKHTFTAAAAFANGKFGPQTPALTITINDPAGGPPAPTDPVIEDGVANGVLRITGTDNNDTILIRRNSNDATRLELVFNGVLSGTTYEIAELDGILVDGKAGDDRIELTSQIALPSKIYGRAGNDTLSGGSGADRVYGGDGNDWLAGNAGNDILYGEAGNDRLFGGNGKDYLSSGAGTNTLRGGSSRDRIFAKKKIDNYRGNGGDIISLLS